ncbi:hypothetical protein FERRO_14740 [Ferrovum sp. JA12]|uniref:hypothetical protein n=1 Tax=Ferrovum sp. JA12 TaxID=1356299 RepID=UPI00070383C4|nr:hypothetical protein [Ferrovum sp. JA12]KRH78487.1 hypothetical protein FERRO_14740 [Ferrovum sp. JA12]
MYKIITSLLVSLFLALSFSARAETVNQSIFSQPTNPDSLEGAINHLKNDLHLRPYQYAMWDVWSQSMIELSQVPQVYQDSKLKLDDKHLIQTQLDVMDDFERRAHYALARTQLFMGDLDVAQQHKITAFWKNSMPAYHLLPHSSPFNLEDVVGVTGCDRHCVN